MIGTIRKILDLVRGNENVHEGISHDRARTNEDASPRDDTGEKVGEAGKPFFIVPTRIVLPQWSLMENGIIIKVGEYIYHIPQKWEFVKCSNRRITLLAYDRDVIIHLTHLDDGSVLVEGYFTPIDEKIGYNYTRHTEFINLTLAFRGIDRWIDSVYRRDSEYPTENLP